MSGFFEDHNEDESSKKTIVLAILAASLVFFAFLLILYQKTGGKKDAALQADNSENVQEEEDLQIGKSNLTSQDMDFWDMFRDPDEADADEKASADRDETEGKAAVFTEQGPKPDKIKENDTDTDSGSRWETGDPNDGTHISLTDESGKKTWYEILDIPKSTYSATFVKKTADGMLTYEENGTKAASGVDLSQNSNIVDLSSLKDAGASFAMIRAIYRDKSNGVIVPDTSFSDHAAKAKESEMQIGVYADSAAINENEAIEEANYAVANAQTVDAKYPIVISLPKQADNGRTSNLSNIERTKIVKAFCDQVRSYGQKPVIRATKADLIAKLNMEDLTAYDIWVVESGEESGGNPYFTDFPYVFTMWQYAEGRDLSFVNYEQH